MAGNDVTISQYLELILVFLFCVGFIGGLAQLCVCCLEKWVQYSNPEKYKNEVEYQERLQAEWDMIDKERKPQTHYFVQME